MNILIFTSQIHKVGGYERLSVELSVELNRVGYRADLLCLYTNDLDGTLNAQKKIMGSGVQKVHYLGLPVKPFFNSVLKSVFRLRKLLLTGKYTAVEVSGFTPTLVAVLGTIGIDVKVLVGIHAQYHKKSNKGFRFFVWRNILRLSPKVNFYAISQAVARDWIIYSKTHPERTSVVLNSVNEEYFHATSLSGVRDEVRERFGFRCDQILLLFVGRLTKSKGIDTLFEAVKPLLRDYPHYHLIFVGREDDSESPSDAICLHNIKYETLEAGWGSRVHFLGERLDVPAIMAACDLLVHPARTEGFGLVLGEALAVGLPVVASNIGGIPEILAGTDSLMVPADDARALKDAIASVLARPRQKVVEAVSKGKSRAEAFRTEKRTRAIVSLLQS